MRVLMLLVPITWLAVAAAARADAPEADPALAAVTHWSLLIENDMWGHPKSDRNYTMGVSWAHYGPRGAAPGIQQRALESVDGALFGMAPLAADAPPQWVIATSNFTPRDITVRAPVQNDRPYASLLYAGQTNWRLHHDTLTETQLQVGILGTSLGREGQTLIHRQCCRDRLPMGWDNQIGAGGSPTFLYHIKRVAVLNDVFTDRLAVQLAHGADVGYLVRGFVGAAVYGGATAEDFRQIHLSSAANPTPWLMAERVPTAAPAGAGLSGWVDYELSAFAYNELLEGGWSGANRLRYRWRDIAPLVHKINAGVEVTFIARWLGLWASGRSRLYLTQSWRSKDLKRNDETRHYWGGLIYAHSL